MLDISASWKNLPERNKDAQNVSCEMAHHYTVGQA